MVVCLVKTSLNQETLFVPGSFGNWLSPSDTLVHTEKWRTVVIVISQRRCRAFQSTVDVHVPFPTKIPSFYQEILRFLHGWQSIFSNLSSHRLSFATQSLMDWRGKVQKATFLPWTILIWWSRHEQPRLYMRRQVCGKPEEESSIQFLWQNDCENTACNCQQIWHGTPQNHDRYLCTVHPREAMFFHNNVSWFPKRMWKTQAQAAAALV